jgi:hypothetical protein
MLVETIVDGGEEGRLQEVGVGYLRGGIEVEKGEEREVG